MSAQHTPGPWLAEGGKVFAETGRFFDNPVAIVGVPLGKNDSRFGELEANARLIAAAPDLLEALEKWLGPSDDPNAGWRGSGGDHEVYACEYCNAKHGDCTQIPHSDTCPIPRARAAIAKATGQKGGA